MKKKQHSLLVVEDEAVSCDLLVRQLENDGYHAVAVAENGVKALTLLADGSFDLVFLDIDLPEKDGYQVLEQIKGDLRLKDTPVIMISGSEDVEAVARCIEMGADDYLRKPFNPVLLRARMRAVLTTRRHRASERAAMVKTREIARSGDRLIGTLLPNAVANELRATGNVEPRRHENVAVLFCDLVGFTPFSERTPPEAVIRSLRDVFGEFERIAREHGLEPIKTIGDELMAVANLLEANEAPLASSIAAGLAMVAAARAADPPWECRVGVDKGSVVAGIVGAEKIQFDVWGDCVNTAARLTGIGNPGTVTLTYDNWLEVDEVVDGRLLGERDIKGKGSIELVECTGLRCLRSNEDK